MLLYIFNYILNIITFIVHNILKLKSNNQIDCLIYTQLHTHILLRWIGNSSRVHHLLV